ncbi:1-deoxy-D-xylulose-5-phosphate reductoisomerase, partial [Vibrio parahaemolyticus]
HGISSILLTGSGGPFRYADIADLDSVTPAQAIAHPNWSMGPKISVDSATMMNKGLEYIEAKWLFNAARDQLKVIIHPQSVIHSMVQYRDGSVLAQMGEPDMATPIALTMSYP